MYFTVGRALPVSSSKREPETEGGQARRSGSREVFLPLRPGAEPLGGDHTVWPHEKVFRFLQLGCKNVRLRECSITT